MSPTAAVLIEQVLLADNIPAHDATVDLAEKIGDDLEAFGAYVASVRTVEQGRAALLELVDAIRAAVTA